MFDLPALFASQPAVRSAFTAFFAQLNSKHTDRAYAAAAHDFSAWCSTRGIRELEQVNAETAREYLSHHAQTTAPATLKQRAVCVRKLLTSVANSETAKRAFAAIAIPRVVSERKRKAVLSERDLARMLHTSTGGALIDLRDRAIMAFLVTCFVPVRVLCRLNTRTYFRNRTGAWLQLGAWGETYPCPSALATCIDHYLNAARAAPNEDTYLFRAIAGASGAITERPLSQPDVYRIVQRRAATAGINGRVSPRELRAAGLARFFRMPHALTKALEIAQDLADHQSWRSTIRYAPADARVPRKKRIDHLHNLAEWGDQGDPTLLDDWGDSDGPDEEDYGPEESYGPEDYGGE